MARVNDIRYVAYAVPDFEAERVFYRDKWKLREIHQQDGNVYFAAEGDDELFVVRLRQAPHKRLDAIGLSAPNRADVDDLFGKVKAHGCRVIHEPRDLTGFGGGYGFRFFSKDGLSFEISSDVARGVPRVLTRWEGIPQKMSHIVLHSPDHKAMAQFFIDVLGFRLSDWLGDFMAFLRCDEWHHRIAVLPGPPCLNHVAYEMPSVDDMMSGVRRLKGQDVEICWGPGRHTAGNNTFSYFVTPNGFTVEYTAELEKIDEATWRPTVHTPSARTIDQWGIGVGGPEVMPHPEPDAGLFTPAEV